MVKLINRLKPLSQEEHLPCKALQGSTIDTFSINMDMNQCYTFTAQSMNIGNNYEYQQCIWELFCQQELQECHVMTFRIMIQIIAEL